MTDILILCVGKLKEKFYTEAAAEYTKRLGAFCRVTVKELPEAKRSASPSPAETAAALSKEAASIKAAVPASSAVIALCIEGDMMSSEELSARLGKRMNEGVSRFCFVIGGSDGLSSEIKDMAELRLSMSRMTFPHHLARVMLLEQLYRAFSISAGGKYHK